MNDIDSCAIFCAKNKEYAKAAAVEALSLTVSIRLSDGSYKKETGEASKLRRKPAETKKQLLELKGD